MEMLWFPLLFLGSLVATIYSALVSVRWVLGPLDVAAKNRLYPIQFSLGDFLCLFVQVQLLLAGPAMLIRRADHGQDMAPLVLVSVLIIGLAFLIWWTGVRTLSRAGIHDALPRALTLIVAIPLGYAASLAIPAVGIAIVGSIVSHQADHSWAPMLTFCELAMGLLVLGLGRMTRHVLATADRRREPPAQISDSTSLPPEGADMQRPLEE